MVPAVRVGTHMFVLLERKNWQAVTVLTAKQRRERQKRAVISQRRFRRRKSGMNTTQGSRTASSIFIGRWTPKVLFSLRDRPYRHGQLRRQLGIVSQAHADQNSPQSRIRRFNRQARDTIEGHYCRVFVDQTGRTIIAPLGGMCRWAKRYPKDVSADLQLREAETG
jgi:hypothetical protein